MIIKCKRNKLSVPITSVKLYESITWGTSPAAVCDIELQCDHLRPQLSSHTESCNPTCNNRAKRTIKQLQPQETRILTV